MSRIDPYDFEHPPGLGVLRNRGSNGGEQMHRYQHPSLVSYTPPDRRTSLGMGGYALYPGSTPRSMGMQEQEYGFGVIDSSSGPNRHNPHASNAHIPVHPFSSFNHHSPHRPSPPPPPLSQPSPNHAYLSYHDREIQSFNYARTPASEIPPRSPPNISSSRSTLWWGEIEPWMDEEYAKQVCGLMGWDPVNVKVPHPAPDPTTGQQANNPGYCFLTFPTPAHAASVLAQINNGGNAHQVTMPNSSKPFVLNWASSVPSATPMTPSFIPSPGAASAALQQYPKEYSIFVGDLAPETSNSDLVAVFRNPVLGLRNDREPKFIRPFISCKSAKIMLDPVTGVSRGYGFVRFTDEADQQRALIEMHGLYCLSRPMRISPATAKFKPPPTISPLDLPQVQFPHPSLSGGLEQQPQPITIALPLPSSSQTKSVSAPIAATSSSNSSLNSNGVLSSGSTSTLGGSNSTNSLSSGTGSSASASSGFGSVTSEEMMNLPNSVLAQIAQQYATGEASPIKAPVGDQDGMRQVQAEEGGPRYTISEESWKHHAQARAILGNLIGPNGEQLTSTDPYNTTVFVGGLSPLISEETLRTFFAPFGDIHYVKVPVGKHCGFVQFVRKADAERAIEKMQGFPVGGSRIRLSWGRSQYKAAQAAAQAAQAAALQTHFPPSIAPVSGINSMTQEQAIQLLQKFSMQGYHDSGTSSGSEGNGGDIGGVYSGGNGSGFAEEKMRASYLASREDGTPPFEYPPGGYAGRPDVNPAIVETRPNRSQSFFSPFSPDPNLYSSEMKRRESVPYLRTEMLPHPSKAYAPGFFPLPSEDIKSSVNGNGNNGLSKISSTSTRPPSASRYNSFLDSSSASFQMARAPGRHEPVSRPSSGQPEGQDFDSMHDLNGTLASLDLDKPQWRSSPERSGSGNSSVQFKMKATPSP